jgi:hypothetical protein
VNTADRGSDLWFPRGFLCSAHEVVRGCFLSG